MPDPGLHPLDYLVVLCYVGILVGIAGYFAKKQKSTDEYFAGGRSMPGWAVGMSVMATSISSVTFLAYPGEGFSGNWITLLLDLDNIFNVDYLNFPHHSYMIGVYSHLVLFGAGYLASLFFPSERPPRNLTFYGWLNKTR